MAGGCGAANAFESDLRSHQPGVRAFRNPRFRVVLDPVMIAALASFAWLRPSIVGRQKSVAA